MPLPKISPPTLGHSGHCPDYSFYYFLFTIIFYYFTWNGPEMFCWPRLTYKRVEPVVSISWASCWWFGRGMILVVLQPHCCYKIPREPLGRGVRYTDDRKILQLLHFILETIRDKPILWYTNSKSWIADRSVTPCWFQWLWVTLKGGMQWVKFFWQFP